MDERTVVGLQNESLKFFFVLICINKLYQVIQISSIFLNYRTIKFTLLYTVHFSSTCALHCFDNKDIVLLLATRKYNEQRIKLINCRHLPHASHGSYTLSYWNTQLNGCQESIIKIDCFATAKDKPLASPKAANVEQTIPVLGRNHPPNPPEKRTYETSSPNGKLHRRFNEIKNNKKNGGKPDQNVFEDLHCRMRMKNMTYVM